MRVKSCNLTSVDTGMFRQL